MSNKINARDLLSIEPLVALKQLPPKFTLVFDDGEMQTTRRRTVVSSYFWEYHRKYPEIPLLIKHHILPEWCEIIIDNIFLQAGPG